MYHIAVDGLEGAAGDIVLSWNVNLLEGLLTVVNIVPGVSVVLPGGSLNLSVNAQGLGLTYQWYLNCQPIPGATLSSLQLVNLQPANVGDYTVHIRDLLGVETASDAANVQLNVTDGKVLDVSAFDKFLESSDSAKTSLAAATSRLQRASFRRSPIRKMSGGPARGYRGTQVFSTVGATKDPGEPNHCGETGGASEWYAYQPPASGLLTLDTEGSTFDTVLAVYTGPGTDFESLVSVACDNNSGSDGKTSKVVFHATKDTVYYIAVDGVGGASGTVNLNYVLKIPPTISSIAGLTTDEDTPLSGVAFTISYGDTAATNVTVTGSSSNPDLVPNENISFSGAGTNRTATLTPVTNQNGTTTITITVTDADGQTSSTSFLLTVNAVNDPPTISSVPDQTTDKDAPTPAIPFTISDLETTAGSLTVAGSSSNQELVPDANIAFGGSGSDRTVTLMPATNQFGTAKITITVTDPGGASASSSFLLTVNPVNDLPTISHLADQVTIENTPTAEVPFTVGDVETAAASLRLDGGSSNTNLVPNENIVFSGAGSNRTVTVTPAGAQTGTAVITITVTDTDGGAASETFVLTVNSVQALQFVSSAMLNDGAFRLRLTGSPLQNTVIQISSNLTDWLPVFTNSDQTNMVEWIDTSVTNNELRFYRAVR